MKSRNFYSALLLIFVIGFFLRLMTALQLPIFGDEAFLVRWAGDALDGRFWQSVIEHNKKPLHIWLIAPFLFLPIDPQMAGRILSVMIGSINIVLISALSARLFDRVTGIAAGAIAAVCPYLVFFDGVVGQEVLIAMVGIFMLSVAVRIHEKPSIPRAALFGVLLGIAVSIKETAGMFALLGFPAFLEKDRSPSKDRVKLIAVAASVSVGVFFLFSAYPVFVLHKGFFIGNEYVGSTLLNRQFFSNSSMIVSSMAHYMGLLLFVPLMAFIFERKHLPLVAGRFCLTVLVIFFGTALTFVLFAQKLFPRHLAAFVPLLIPFCGGGVVTLGRRFSASQTRRKVLIIISVLLCLPTVAWLAMMIVDPVKAPIPEIDRKQFFTEWPSGIGLRDVYEIIDRESTEHKVTVLVPPLDGMPKDALLVHYRRSERVTIKPVDLYGRPISELIDPIADSVFLIVVNQPIINLTRIAETSPGLIPVKMIERPEGKSRLVILRWPHISG